jgi:cyclophilin family peptidyl-prolyl cis-trans isomerase
VPTEKRARQKAFRQKKRAAQARKVKLRKRLRASAFVIGGAAVVVVLVLLSTGVFTGGHSPKPKLSKQAEANKLAVAAGCPASPTKRVNTLSWASPPSMTIDPSKSYSATIRTTAGSFVVALDAKTAPNTVNNFVFLADKGFYHCVVFQRVITRFMDQAGDPTGTGSGGPGYKFANENVPASYATGDVAMANSGGTDTNGSQFFVVVPGGATTLDADLKSGAGYSLFGKVTSGLPVVEKINKDGSSSGTPKVVQRILSVKISES